MNQSMKTFQSKANILNVGYFTVSFCFSTITNPDTTAATNAPMSNVRIYMYSS